MLDKSMIGVPLPKDPLKCEKCEMLFCNEEGYEVDWNCIDDTGLCCQCYDEEKEFEREIYKTLEDNG